MKKPDTFFVGWSNDISGVDRRFVLGAGAMLVVGAAGLGSVLGRLQNAPGDGVWNQGAVRTWTGKLVATPYPMLRTLDLGGSPRSAFLATSGKTAVRLPADLVGQNVILTASLIQRGDHAMLAVADGRNWISPLAKSTVASLDLGPEEDLGPAGLVGEILDAKCWFGAMRPGFGKTHKACATLCARGGLPLAFCADGCGDGEAPVFLDERGRPHTRTILPYVADRVFVIGRRVRVADMIQFRAPITSIRRL